VLDGVADEKEKGRTHPGQMSAEERRSGLVALEKRTLRARAKYASRREVLRQEEDRRAHTGELSDVPSPETDTLTDHQRRTLKIGHALIQHREEHGCLPGTDPDGPPFEISESNFNSKGDFKEWAAGIDDCKLSSVGYSLRQTECWIVSHQGSSEGLGDTLKCVVEYTRRFQNTR